MLLRTSARERISLIRIHALRRPHLLARCPSLQSSSPVSGRRLIVTRPDLLPWRRRRNSKGSHGLLQGRSLATALDDARIKDDIPFGIPAMYSNPITSRNRAPYELRPFDPSNPLLIEPEFDPFPRSKMSPHGIPGDVDSMLSLFDACVQVDQLDRAAQVLKRLGEMDCLPGPELMQLHNRYLRANIERHYAQPNPKWAEPMQVWYERRIRSAGLPQTPETVACMLKISLLSTESTEDVSNLQRRINRYMGMMPGDAGLQVYSMADILSDQDLARITSLCTTHNYSADDWIPNSDESFGSGTLEESEQLADVDVVSHEPSPSPEDTEVKAVPQKGLGLKTLHKVLSFFGEIRRMDISQLPLAERREIQARLERDCVEAAICRWREEHHALMKMGKNTSLATNALNTQLYDWHCALESRLKQEFALFDAVDARESKAPEDVDRCLVAPFLKQSTPSRLAAISILSVLNTVTVTGADSGPTLSQTVQYLSKAVEEDVKTQQRHEAALQKAKKAKKARKRVLKDHINQINGASEISREEPAWTEPLDNQAFGTLDTKSWSLIIRTKLGACLLSALMDSVKVTIVREHPVKKTLVSQIQPAFAKTSIFRKGKRIGMITPNKFLVDLLKREPRGDILARHLPMLVEPEPWSKFDKGGFLEFPSTLVRIKNGEKDQKIYTEAAIQRGDLEQVCKGLDVLGRTAWKINQPVFRVMLEAWNSGEAIAKLPPLNPDIALPTEPEASDDPLQRRQWVQAVKAVENEKSGLHSERCFINFQLEIANAFQDQTFYFPHNMDFRGRAYPLPTYLNHMGADNARGLLRFAQGKALGENGLRWLKVHLANVFGFDKASIKEREEFTMRHIDDITDSATNPLGGQRWWLKAEDQWQCLAACLELNAALQSPDPVKYVSHLPVHQDGTCNGLQHYAALGGDLWGAQQVNLIPGDRPADVYSAVAELVKQSIAEDVKQDNPFAKIMDGKITRKVVKQTVMTNVYGVTFMGARAQVLKQIEAAHPEIFADHGIHPILLASYVVTKIFKGLSTMFRGAHDIQYWLGECAGRVCRAITPEQMDRLESWNASAEFKSKSKGKGKKAKRAMDLKSHFKSTIVWTTPLRLPVVQPYRKSGIRTIPTVLQDLNLTIPERSDPVHRRKQLQAFPPNFIHSLDASHMLLSALECDTLGLTFAAVHDSFWTHAADVDVMNRVLRDSFIRIHSEDVIQRLAFEFEARYKGSLYMEKLESGSNVYKEIIAHRATTKMSLQDELFQERERQRLLHSTDPADVEKGTQMETPASIYEKHRPAGASVAQEDMAAIGLGHVPSAAETMKDAAEDTSIDGVELISSDINKDSASIKEMLSVTGFEAKVAASRAPSATKTDKVIGLWLPLTFPEIPKKGDFDVTRLKDSQYFFS